MAHFTLSSFTLLIIYLQAQHLCAVKREENGLNFFALGDWGGSPIPRLNYTTKVEKGIAASMAERAEEVKPSFIIALGKSNTLPYFLNVLILHAVLVRKHVR